MLYTNDDFRVFDAVDEQKLRDMENESKFCPICKTEDPEEFYISIQTDECVGCSDCININQWTEF